MYSEEELIEWLQKAQPDEARAPTQSDLREFDDAPTTQTFRSRFGSWESALREAGFSEEQINHRSSEQKYTDEELLELLHQLADDLGRTPRLEDIRDLAEPSPSTIPYRFGSYNTALREAGFDLNKRHEEDPQYSDEQLLNYIREVADELGEPPSIQQMKSFDWTPSITTYQCRFESWLDARDLALKTTHHSQESTAQRRPQTMSDETDLDDEVDDVLYATDPESAGSETTVESDKPNYQQPEWLWRQYHVYERSQPEIADRAGVSSVTISNWMDRNNIPTRRHDKAQSMAKGADKRLWDEEWLRQEYQDAERSMGDIADELGHSDSAVFSALQRAGINTRDRGTANELRHAGEDGSAPWRDPEWMYEMYVNQEFSSLKIAEKCDVDFSTILTWLERHGIPRRSGTEAQLARQKAEKATDDERTLVSSEGIDASWRDIQDRQQDCYIPYRDPDWLRMQLKRGKGYKEIAETCDVDCTGTTVREWAIRFELDELLET